MYRCAVCQSVVPPRTTAIRQVLEWRERDYPPRHNAHAYRDKHSGTRKLKDDPGGQGWEIAREALVCASCAAARPQGAPTQIPRRAARSDRDIAADHLNDEDSR